jgi:hypothetical protein
MKFLASFLLLAALAVPCFAQAPRYPVSANRVTDLKQAKPMLQEFSGSYGLAAINTRTGLGLSGTLEVTDGKIDIVFDKIYAGQGSVADLGAPQVFAFSYILVGRDTVDSGGLFYAEFSYKTSNGTTVTLGLRFYPAKRCIGAATLTDSDGTATASFIAFFAPVSGDVEFLGLLSEASQVFKSAVAENSVAVFTSWADGTWHNPNEQ